MNFLLEDIELEVCLGVTTKERAKKQKILVSFSFEFDTEKAGKSDNITDTVDYFPIYEFLKNFPGDRKFRLLEKFYRELFEGLNNKFIQLKNLQLKIQKFPFESGRVVISEL